MAPCDSNLLRLHLSVTGLVFTQPRKNCIFPTSPVICEKKRAKTVHHHWILVARRLKSSYIFTRVILFQLDKYLERSCYLGWFSAALSGSGSAGSFSRTAAGNRSIVVTDLERV